LRRGGVPGVLFCAPWRGPAAQGETEDVRPGGRSLECSSLVGRCGLGARSDSEAGDLRDLGGRMMAGGSGSFTDSPDPGYPAAVVVGRVAPAVKHIALVQDGGEDRRVLRAYFGAWAVCTERWSPYRIDASGTVLGSLQGPPRLRRGRQLGRARRPVGEAAARVVDARRAPGKGRAPGGRASNGLADVVGSGTWPPGRAPGLGAGGTPWCGLARPVPRPGGWVGCLTVWVGWQGAGTARVRSARAAGYVGWFLAWLVVVS
jgi:hypothetical protein